MLVTMKLGGKVTYIERATVDIVCIPQVLVLVQVHSPRSQHEIEIWQRSVGVIHRLSIGVSISSPEPS